MWESVARHPIVASRATRAGRLAPPPSRSWHRAGVDDSDQVEERIRLALSVPAGEMIHLDAPTTHIAADRPEVQHALRHASRLPGDPVDTLERCLDDTLATLHSPKVRHTVTKLARALVRAPGGEMAADDVLRSIVVAMGEPPADADDRPTHPPTIYVR